MKRLTKKAIIEAVQQEIDKTSAEDPFGPPEFMLGYFRGLKEAQKIVQKMALKQAHDLMKAADIPKLVKEYKETMT